MTKTHAVTLSREDSGDITRHDTRLNGVPVVLADGQSRELDLEPGTYELVVRVLGQPGASSTVAYSGDDVEDGEATATVRPFGSGMGLDLFELPSSEE